MSAPVIATVAFTDSTSDITSLLEVATYTTTATGWYQVQFFCSSLTATARPQHHCRLSAGESTVCRRSPPTICRRPPATSPEIMCAFGIRWAY